MRASEFGSLCMEACIDPGVALENEKIQQALADGDDEKVVELLETEF